MHTEIVPLPYRADLPDKQQLLDERRRWADQEQAAQAAGNATEAREARAMMERMTRRLTRVEHLPAGDTFPYPLRIWNIGDAVWIALNGEHYNLLQRELRRRFPRRVLVIGTLANGSDVWYLPDKDSYGKGLYQEDASTLARGSLETLIDRASKAIEQFGEAS
jgi:hypothetical protein